MLLCREIHVVISREDEKCSLPIPFSLLLPRAYGQKDGGVESTINFFDFILISPSSGDMELCGSTRGHVNPTWSVQHYVVEPNYCLDYFFTLHKVITQVDLRGQVIGVGRVQR